MTQLQLFPSPDDETPANGAFSGGGGNRTRETFPSLTLRQSRLVASIRPSNEGGGWLYFIQAITGGPIKIGRAFDPRVRLQQLQTGRPEQLVLIYAAPAMGRYERRVHSMLELARVKGEWFEEKAALRWAGISLQTARAVRAAATA